MTKVPTGTVYQMGLTVAELRAIIATWPDTNTDGEPSTVWIETGLGLSSPVVAVVPLNIRVDGDGEHADIIFESNAFEKNDGLC